ncbi:MAG: glycosyltransferase [Lachnospiraceae bacterium]|nr:glycosyltransferase [Lachnospiraceae bacterium]
MTKYSIIIPCYNSARVIHQCIDSIVCQSYGFEHFEVILVDDASTDQETIPILREIENRYPDQVMLILCEKNGKQGRARNIGLQYASGDYISFIDSDDWIHRDMFLHLDRIVTSGTFDIVQFRYQGREHYEDKDEKIDDVTYAVYDFSKKEEKRIYLLNSMILNESCTTKIYKKEFLQRASTHFAEGVTYEEPLFTYPLKFYVKKVAVTEIAPYYYRTNPEGTTLQHMNDPDKIYEHMMVQLAVWNDMKKRPFSPEFYDEIELYFVHSYYVESIYFMKQRGFRVSKELFKDMSKTIMEETPDTLHNKHWQDRSLQMEYRMVKLLYYLYGQNDVVIEQTLSELGM